MDGIFISYRRKDTAPYAGRLCDLLRQRQPGKQVFMDIDAIEPGEDFVDVIERTLRASRIVLIIIGHAWLSEKDEREKRRLDNPNDNVAREILMALEAKVRVIPVLVGRATMPTESQLPMKLRKLARINAIELSDERFVKDVDRLNVVIDRVFESTNNIPVAAVPGPSSGPRPQLPDPPRPVLSTHAAAAQGKTSASKKVLILIVVGLCGLVILAAQMLGGGKEPTVAKSPSVPDATQPLTSRIPMSEVSSVSLTEENKTAIAAAIREGPVSDISGISIGAHVDCNGECDKIYHGYVNPIKEFLEARGVAANTRVFVAVPFMLGHPKESQIEIRIDRSGGRSSSVNLPFVAVR